MSSLESCVGALERVAPVAAVDRLPAVLRAELRRALAKEALLRKSAERLRARHTEIVGERSMRKVEPEYRTAAVAAEEKALAETRTREDIKRRLHEAVEGRKIAIIEANKFNAEFLRIFGEVMAALFDSVAAGGIDPELRALAGRMVETSAIHASLRSCDFNHLAGKFAHELMAAPLKATAIREAFDAQMATWQGFTWEPGDQHEQAA